MTSELSFMFNMYGKLCLYLTINLCAKNRMKLLTRDPGVNCLLELQRLLGFNGIQVSNIFFVNAEPFPSLLGTIFTKRKRWI